MAATATATATAKSPFSFQELFEASDSASSTIQPTDAKVIASDGFELAVHIYEPTASTPSKNTALVFYHGGGAHGGAGYQNLARGLAEDFGLTVYLPDIRGHGSSGGPRGDAPSKEQVWKDVDSVLEYVVETHKNKTDDPKILLGGHSSGGGLVVNYATEGRRQRKPPEKQGEPNEGKDSTPVPIGAYVLVSPELGYKSETARPGRTEFARVNIFAFLLNAIFGILGHSRAVRFQYPSELLDQDAGMVGFNTVHMANAITPEAPKEQMRALVEDANVPVGLWIGSEDELFVAESVAAYVATGEAETDGKNSSEILPGKKHLGILVDIHKQIGQWISQKS